MSQGSWKEIASNMEAQIRSGQMVPGTKLPSGDQLAKSLCVDRNAAHRAIEHLQRLGLVVRRRGSGTVVAEWGASKSHRIVLLVDGYSAFHNFPSVDLLRGIQDTLGEESCLVLADSKHDSALEARHLRRLATEADGILLYATALERPTALASVLEDGFPIVALDRLPHGIDMDSAMTDNHGATQSAVQNLIERGHTRIGYLSLHRPEFNSVVDRHAGYVSAMTASGLDAVSAVRWLPASYDITPAVFGQLVQDTLVALRQGPNPITALFCSEDKVGCAVASACEQLGISLLDDLEFGTFNDWHPMTLRTPWNIHRVVQRKYEMGTSAASLLLERIAAPDLAPRSVLVPADLILADAGLEQAFASPTY